MVDFKISEIIDFLEESLANQESCSSNNTTGNEFKLRRVGPPQLYRKRLYMDIIDSQDNQPVTASKPITLERHEQSGIDRTTSSSPHSDEKITIFSVFFLDGNANASDTSSADFLSNSSTDQSLRVSLNNFNETGDLDSDLFNAELENFMENEKN